MTGWRTAKDDHRRLTRGHFADMTDELGFGPEKRRQGNLDILAGKVTFR